MISSSPAPFEKYHRRLVAGALVTPPIIYLALRTFDQSDNAAQSIIRIIEESNSIDYLLITLPATIFALYSFGYFFELFIIGVIAPSSSRVQRTFRLLTRKHLKSIKNKSLYFISYFIASIVLAIFSPIALIIATYYHYFYDQFNTKKSDFQKFLKLSSMGHTNEIEKLVHLSINDTSAKLFILSKLEESKTNIVYILAIYSLIFLLLIMVMPTELPLDMNSLSYFIMTDKLIQSLLKIMLLPFYISSLGFLVLSFGSPQYIWILQSIDDFSESSDAS